MLPAFAFILLALLPLVQTLPGQERQVLGSSGDTAKPASRRLEDGRFLLPAGTRVALSVITGVSSKNAAPGDQVHFQTVAPVAAGGQIVIPVGSYVTGVIIESARPGKVKGKGHLAIRFDSLLLGGTQVDLAGGVGGLDGDNPGTLKRDEGKLESDGSVGKDAAVVGGTALGGAAMGHWISHGGSSGAIGAGAGAAAGAAAVLVSRGPDAQLRRGSTLDMVLSRDLYLPAQLGTAARH